MGIFIFYLAVLFALGFTIRRRSSAAQPGFLPGLFKARKGVSWLVAGFSIFMLHTSIHDFQLLYGLLGKYGIQGFWLLWVGALGTAIVPIVFAPLWKKLDLITDNQFILYRFSGRSARILHLFRAVYVGGLIVSFLLSFQVLAFARVVQVYYQLDPSTAMLVSGGLVCLFALKNSFELKLRYDLFHGLLYFASVACLFYFLSQAAGGFTPALDTLRGHSDQLLHLFPSGEQPKLVYSIAVFLGVQWWSSQLFDGGGPEMARYTAAKSPWKATAAGLFRDVLGKFTGLAVLAIVLVAFAVNMDQREVGFIEVAFQVVPQPYSQLVMLGFFALFITTSEAFMNWGASFLTEDVYRGYIKPEVSPREYRLAGFGLMLTVSVLATAFAFFGERLETLVKVLFSISAGVGPVYILRWFWLRINAWSQLSAMIASGVYTLLFLALEERVEPWWNPDIFDAYEARLLAVTVLTTLTWLLVTFLTPRDEEATLDRFRTLLPSGRSILLRFGLALAVGAVITALYVLAVWRMVQ